MKILSLEYILPIDCTNKLFHIPCIILLKYTLTSEDHAVDVAYSWSVEEHGKTMIVARNNMMWMEVAC